MIEYLVGTHIYKYIKYAFEICYLLLLVAHMYTSLVNPGICLLEKSKDKKDFILCEQQICLINPQKEFEHCPECDICCEGIYQIFFILCIGLDHHCDWIGKCIGKNNLISFYIFVVMIPVFVIVAIIAVFSAMVELD